MTAVSDTTRIGDTALAPLPRVDVPNEGPGARVFSGIGTVGPDRVERDFDFTRLGKMRK